MDQPKTPKMPPGREQLPTMENVAKRLREGSRLTGSAVVLAEGTDAYVDLTLGLKVGQHESPLGTLVCPLCDYPILIALLSVGATMLRVDFRYDQHEANTDWKTGMPDAKKQ